MRAYFINEKASDHTLHILWRHEDLIQWLKDDSLNEGDEIYEAEVLKKFKVKETHKKELQEEEIRVVGSG